MKQTDKQPELVLVVPCWNQWTYTQRFLDSLPGASTHPYHLIIVDNGSTDGTDKNLKPYTCRGGRPSAPTMIITNKKNKGVAPAWNQGVAAALKLNPKWIGILNNDLVMSQGSLDAMIARANKAGWSMVSPGTREGALDYDFPAYAKNYTRDCLRWDAEGYFGWCFLVRREVFEVLGMFDEGFKYGKGEDEDFYRRVKSAGLGGGITGSAFVHHFGSPSIDALREEVGLAHEKANYEKLNAKWGHPSRKSPATKLITGLKKLWWKLRWGHLLKE